MARSHSDLLRYIICRHFAALVVFVRAKHLPNTFVVKREMMDGTQDVRG